MGAIKVRYLVAKPMKAHTIYYWQPTKQLIAEGFLPRRLSNNAPEALLEAEKLNAELDAWRDGDSEEVGRKPGTMSWLIDQYQKDSHFLGLRSETKEGYVKALGYIERWAGDKPYDKISRVAVRAFLDVFEGKARTQKKIYSMGRLLYNFARDLGLSVDNPFEKHRIKSNPPRKQIWTVADETAFIKVAKDRSSMVLAAILAADTGQRQTDLLRLAWPQYDGQYLHIRQSKTGAEVDIPILPRLKKLLNSTQKLSTQILVNEQTGRPYTKGTFGSLFKKYMDRAGIDHDKQFRDLRRTAVVNLALAGCDNKEIASFTGHSLDDSQSILEVYLPRDKRLADSAVLKLKNYRKIPSNLKKGH